MDNSAGILFLIAGAGLALVGVLALTGTLSWFGRLPGDIHVSRGHAHFFAPIVSMIIVSVVLSLILNIFGRLR